MPPRKPLMPPSYDHTQPGARVTDRLGETYTLIGKERVPLCDLPGADLHTLLRFRRESDGEERLIGRTTYDRTVVTYNPPPRIRKRIDKRRRPR